MFFCLRFLGFALSVHGCFKSAVPVRTWVPIPPFQSVGHACRRIAADVGQLGLNQNGTILVNELLLEGTFRHSTGILM